MKKPIVQTKPSIDEAAETLEKQAEAWKTKYMRALADYQNLEKRSQDHIFEVRKFAAEIILSKLLPVVDTFGKVKEHVKDPGFDIAYKELLAVLVEQGVERMEVLGKVFDPKEMDCIEVVAGKDTIVMEEVLPGFLFRGKVLRVARVKVGKSEQASN